MMRPWTVLQRWSGQVVRRLSLSPRRYFLTHPDENRRQAGAVGEGIALGYLKRRGYRLLKRNYYGPHGEIDLVMRHKDTVVFVEVKARRNEEYAPAHLAVNSTKRRHLHVTAYDFLNRYRLQQFPCRFDIVTVTGESRWRRKVNHHQNAFRVNRWLS